MNFKLASLPAVLLALAGSASAQIGPGGDGENGLEIDIIDFEGIAPGTILSEVYGNLGSGPVLVSGYNPFLGDTNAAVIFDSSNPTGYDDDLGTPNEDFGGPGIGEGGKAGSEFQNDLPQGNILIVAENLYDGDGDGLVDIPDDADVTDSLLSFDFSAIGTVSMEGIYLIDVEADEPNAIVDFYDSDDNLIQTTLLPATGNNGAIRWIFGGVGGVARMTIDLNGSGAIDEIIYTPDDQCEAMIGDYVWFDENCDGIQDIGEEGLAGITVWLKDDMGVVLSTTVTNTRGLYLFDGLCAGSYIVEIDPTTLPPGYIPAPCNVGGDDTVDNDCSPAIVILTDDTLVDLTIDFGFCEEDNSRGEGCTPGYWKQPQHFDSWPSGLSPGTLFSDVFENAFPGKTLLQVLETGGGGLNALGRHTVAALLNAENDDVAYGMNGDMVIELFNDVYPGTLFDYEGLKDFFAHKNEEGCPLN